MRKLLLCTLLGIIDKNWEIKQIYTYADRHLHCWFPQLPSYVAFVQRLNRASEVFAPLLEIIQEEQEASRVGDTQSLLIDSFPVVLAKQGHRFKACVAPELANHGYCSTKKLYFYGVRVHVIGRRQAGTLPSPEYIGVTEGSYHNGKIFDQIRPELVNEEVFGDKAYQRPDTKEVQELQNLNVLTPVKKKKGQKHLDADEQWLSTAVSKVRSYPGLMVHIFGRLAAAMFFWNQLRVCP